MKRWDWKAIFVCLLIAFTFWVFHSLNTEHTTNIDFPIELEYNPKKIAVVEAPPKYISVNVSGYGWNLLSKSFGFRLKPIKVPVNFPIQTNYLTAKTLMGSVTHDVKELKVNHLLEDSIFFRLDTIITVRVPVLVDTKKLNLPENIRVSSSIRTSPDSVHLIGPSSLIEKSNVKKGVHINYRFTIREKEFNAAVNLEHVADPLRIIESEALLRFHTAIYKRAHSELKIVVKNAPKSKKIHLSPESAFVDYLLREHDVPIHKDNAIIEVDFKNLDTSSMTIKPDVEIPIKYLEPQVVPQTFKVIFEDK